MRTPQDVQQALDDLGLEIEVVIHEESTATAQEAADAIGCELGQIVKSLCFVVAGDPVIVLTAGDRRVSTRKLGTFYELSRKQISMATPEQTLAASGFAVGGVSPVGHTLPTVIDESLTRFATVYAAAGSPNAIFPIALETLVEVTGGEVAAVTKKA